MNSSSIVNVFCVHILLHIPLFCLAYCGDWPRTGEIICSSSPIIVAKTKFTLHQLDFMSLSFSLYSYWEFFEHFGYRFPPEQRENRRKDRAVRPLCTLTNGQRVIGQACSGSQSQRRICLLLPARGASHWYKWGLSGRQGRRKRLREDFVFAIFILLYKVNIFWN